MSTTNQSITATVATYDAVRASIAARSPLHIVYATDGTIIKERTIRPMAIEVGKKGSDLIIAHDSLRDGVISLRVDRVVAISGQVAERI